MIQNTQINTYTESAITWRLAPKTEIMTDGVVTVLCHTLVPVVQRLPLLQFKRKIRGKRGGKLERSQLVTL